MKSEDLKILFIEDSPEDLELEQRALRRAGLAFRTLRAEDRSGLLQALTEFKPDLIISDFKLPCLDGLTALQIAKEHAPKIPFIFVSGTIREERAIESLKHGATDYVVKDNLEDLVAKVNRAFKEVQDRKKRRTIEE